MVGPATPLEDLSEKDWELQVIGTAGKPGLARALGWRVYHTLRSRGSQPGYPDWTLVRERVMFLELKKEKGIVSPAQKEWLGALRDAGAEVYLVRPRHLQEIARVLAARPHSADGALSSVQAIQSKLVLEDELEFEII